MAHMRVLAFSAHALAFLLLVFPAGFALAACGSGELCNPLKFNSLTQFLSEVLKIVVAILFPLIVLFFVFIGFKFVAAQGPEDLKKTRELFFWAVVGALIVLGAQVLSSAIDATVRSIQAGGGG